MYGASIDNTPKSSTRPATTPAGLGDCLEAIARKHLDGVVGAYNGSLGYIMPNPFEINP